MKTVEILRTYLEKETLGTLTSFDENQNIIYTCKTLELPWLNNKVRVSCIPEGEYSVIQLPPNKHFPYKYYHVQNVKGRSEICIHRGNFKQEVLGCIMLGKNHVDINKDGLLDIEKTTITMNEFTDVMGSAKFKLIIKKAL